jgi:DNA-binding CsgD family transcriptional regulator
MSVDSAAAVRSARPERGSEDAEHAEGPRASVLSVSEHDEVGVAILDRGLRVIGVNGSFARYVGREVVDVSGKVLPDLVGPTFGGELRPELDRVAAGSTHVVERRFVPAPAEEGPGAEMVAVAVGLGAASTRTIMVMLNRSLPQVRAERPGKNGRGSTTLKVLDARILEGMASGLSTVQLAGRLYLSHQGIEYHVGSMLRRFRVPNRTALVCKVYALGIFVAGSWPPKVRAEYIDFGV